MIVAWYKKVGDSPLKFKDISSSKILNKKYLIDLKNTLQETFEPVVVSETRDRQGYSSSGDHEWTVSHRKPAKYINTINFSPYGKIKQLRDQCNDPDGHC